MKGLIIFLAGLMVGGTLGAFVVYVSRGPIVHARQPTEEQKVAMMDEVYTAAVENNIREIGKEKE